MEWMCRPCFGIPLAGVRAARSCRQGALPVLPAAAAAPIDRQVLLDHAQCVVAHVRSCCSCCSFFSRQWSERKYPEERTNDRECDILVNAGVQWRRNLYSLEHIIVARLSPAEHESKRGEL